MNILITGGAGFIGSHIAQAYLEDKHRVVIVDDLSSGEAENIPQGAIFHQTSILDPEVEKIIVQEKIEVINHHAAQISVPGSVADPVFDANSNIIGTLLLLKNAVGSGVRRFVFASTGGAIYGDQEYFPAREDHPCRPKSPYAISKLTAENYIGYFVSQSDLEATIFRYGNVYGPRQKPQGEAGVVAIFCQRLLNGQPPVVFGDGSQTRDFISVMDVVQANRLALESGCKGTYNIGTGTETSVNELTRSLIKLSGQDLTFTNGPAREYEAGRSSLDYRKFHKTFGWEPTLSLEEGLSETLNYFASKKIRKND